AGEDLSAGLACGNSEGEYPTGLPSLFGAGPRLHMGIYDREYIRERPGFLGSFYERGLMCKWLIGINIVLFLLQLIARNAVRPELERLQGLDPLTTALWLDPSKVLEGQFWRLLTYAFLHDTTTPLHILFNMLFLWWFGSDVEDLYGPREFLAFY